MKTPSDVYKRKLMFFAFSCTFFEKNKTYLYQSKRLKLLTTWGFSIIENYITTKNLYEIHNFYKKIDANRYKIKYEIDGIVIKVNKISLQKILGNTSTYPHWAIAFKFRSKKHITKITSINFQIGRTGVITPVATLKPIIISGVRIKRVSLFNKNQMNKLNIHIGNSVEIIRSGDVIPKIVTNIDFYKKNKKKIKFPIFCPSCQSKIEEDSKKKISRCTGKLICKKQKQKSLQYFASKKGLNITGLGTKIIKKLILKQLVTKIVDFFYLTLSDFQKLKNIKKKTAYNLITSINKSKIVSLNKLICSFGIPGVGSSTSLKIEERFQSLEKIISAKIADLASIPTIGLKTAKNIFIFFKNNLSVILELKKILFIKKEKKHFRKVLQFFVNKIVAFSGTLLFFNRKKACENILKMGCKKIDTSITKKTHFLILGEKPGRKKELAKRLKIKIITEKKFLLILKKYHKIINKQY